MADLFEKISCGSILLWNVKDDSDLPKKREIIRLLGTDSFTYYKYDGHHRHYIRSLARLMDCLDPATNDENYSYWPRTCMSHFLFTEQKIEANSFFLLKYWNACLGSYHVSKPDLESLDQALNLYEKARRIIGEVSGWPQKVLDHQEILLASQIQDDVVTGFNSEQLIAITQDYGEQALTNTLIRLRVWKEVHFWKSSSPA